MDINSKAQRELHNFWQERIKTFGNSFEVVGWTKESQQKRFAALSQLGKLDGATLLDVGCGRGDLLSYFLNNNIDIEYTGYDLNPEMIEFCRELHPKYTANFKVSNILEEKVGQSFDYVSCIGVLNQVTTPDSPEFATGFIKQLFAIAGKAVAVSITSLHAPYKTPDTFYFDPAEMLQRVSSITTCMRLDHSYLQNDFTLFLYK